MRSFINRTPRQILSGGMDVAYSIHSNKEKCLHNFGGDPEGIKFPLRHS